MTDEPLSAILAEMRDERIILIEDADVMRCMLRNLADRIERAAKNAENAFGMALAIEDGLRKRDKQSSPGNAAAMRKALEEIDKNTDLLDIAEDLAPNLHPSHSFVAIQIRKIARAALSKPARNCDAGTAQEQYARFNKYCNARWRSNKSNPCGRAGISSNPCAKCYSIWGQLPYKEKEEDSNG